MDNNYEPDLNTASITSEYIHMIFDNIQEGNHSEGRDSINRAVSSMYLKDPFFIALHPGALDVALNYMLDVFMTGNATRDLLSIKSIFGSEDSGFTVINRMKTLAIKKIADAQ